MKKKQSLNEVQMRLLAEQTGLTFDGGDDNRLFTETIFTYSSNSKREYNKIQKHIDNFEIKGKGFTIGVWNDSSGYEYWTIQQEEDNYIQITVYIEGTPDPEEIKKAVLKAETEFDSYVRT